jgi:SPP1 family predicted phage head-tail adaptor
MRDDIAYLISKTIVEDEIGNQIEQEEEKEVFCTVESITQSEYFQASQSGLKPQIKLTMSEFDYSGEAEVEYNTKRYAIYRTFLRNDEHIELYLTEKAGV